MEDLTDKVENSKSHRTLREALEQLVLSKLAETLLMMKQSFPNS